MENSAVASDPNSNEPGTTTGRSVAKKSKSMVVDPAAEAKHEAAQAGRKEKRKAAKADKASPSDKASENKASADDTSDYDSEYDDDTIWTEVDADAWRSNEDRSRDQQAQVSVT